MTNKKKKLCTKSCNMHQVGIHYIALELHDSIKWDAWYIFFLDEKEAKASLHVLAAARYSRCIRRDYTGFGFWKLWFSSNTGIRVVKVSIIPLPGSMQKTGLYTDSIQVTESRQAEFPQQTWNTGFPASRLTSFRAKWIQVTPGFPRQVFRNEN